MINVKKIKSKLVTPLPEIQRLTQNPIVINTESTKYLCTKKKIQDHEKYHDLVYIERKMGIEPTLLDWKSRVLATIRLSQCVVIRLGGLSMDVTPYPPPESSNIKL